MRKDRGSVFDLRKAGKSYREIEKELGVPRSTLSEWFRGVEWSKHVGERNKAGNISRSKDRLQALNKGREDRLHAIYSKAEAEAVEKYEVFKQEPLFMAGLMVYAGEGDKVTSHLVRMSNSELYIHQIFLAFARKYLEIKGDSIRFGIVAYPDTNLVEGEQYWSNGLGIPKEQFHKTQIIQGRSKKRKLQFGTGMSILSNTVLKKKVMKWLELCALDAGLV